MEEECTLFDDLEFCVYGIVALSADFHLHLWLVVMLNHICMQDAAANHNFGQ